MLLFPLQIGGTKTDFVVTVTDAPRAYDGFGTFTIKEFASNVDIAGQETRGDARMVLVRPEHLEWQRNRYFSGIYAAIVDNVEDVFELSDVADAVWELLKRESNHAA